MADISFEDGKSYAEHIEVLLADLDVIDDQLGPMLRELFPLLEAAQDDAGRRHACTVFNAGILQRLDKMAETLLKESNQ